MTFTIYRYSEEHWSCMYHTHVLSRRYIGTHTSTARNEHLKAFIACFIENTTHKAALNGKYALNPQLLYVLKGSKITCIASSVTGIFTL